MKQKDKIMKNHTLLRNEDISVYGLFSKSESLSTFGVSNYYNFFEYSTKFTIMGVLVENNILKTNI